MNRPPFEVADIVRACGRGFIEKNRSWLTWIHIRVLVAIERCRTAALGGHLDRCGQCGKEATSFNSCRSRHCPKCQVNARERWLDGRRAELLPVKYVHVVFTIPHEFAGWPCRTRRLSTISCSRPVRRPCWRLPPIRSISEPRSASSACCTPGDRISQLNPHS